MDTRDRDTTVVHSSGGSGAGWFIAGALVVAVIAGGFFLVSGGFSTDKTLDIELKTPAATETPAN